MWVVAREWLFGKEAPSPPRTRRVAHVAGGEAVPLDEVENDDALVGKLPHRGFVVDIGADVDFHVELLVEEDLVRPAADCQPVRRDRHYQVACRRALRHLDLDEDHPSRLTPVVAVGDSPQALLVEQGRVDVLPERCELHRPRRLPFGLDALAQDRRHLHRAHLIRHVVACLVVGKRHLVCVDPEGVARRWDAFAVNILVQIPVVYHRVVAAPCKPRAPLHLAIGPPALTDVLTCLSQLFGVLHLLLLLLAEFLATRQDPAVGEAALRRRERRPRVIRFWRALIDVLPAEILRLLAKARCAHRGASAEHLGSAALVERCVPVQPIELPTKRKESAHIAVVHAEHGQLR
mmetsp:Transcript_41687/g.109955  ORF Transcript_41687/g.109955 Transcript_41687/m.109955 type:complete len:348 (+) Transcript_41687:448-1491(+)